MVLIKEQKQKKRQVWKLDDGYKKVWLFNDIGWLDHHVSLINQVFPGHIREHGCSDNDMWMITNTIPGIPASQFPHTDEFIRKIYNFCVEHIHSTAPYTHGDWSLSNIIIDGDNIQMCDWDNYNLWSLKDAMMKMRMDLRTCFGEKFNIGELR